MAGKIITYDSRGRRTNRVKPSERKRMVQLKQLGYSITNIAGRLSRKPETVKNNLAKEEKLAEHKVVRRASEKTVADIEQMADLLRGLTSIPLPLKPFLPESKEDEAKIADDLSRGNSHSYISLLNTPPWWRKVGSVDIRRNLSSMENALLDLVLKHPHGKNIKLDEWQITANNYLSLKQANAKVEDINAAYNRAKDVTRTLHAEMAKAVVNLSV